MENIILFGASSLGEKAFNDLKEEYRILFFCDNNPNKWGHKFCGLEIKSPKDINKSDKVYVVITSMYTLEISNQLLNKGINNFGVYHSQSYNNNEIKSHFIEDFNLGDFENKERNKNVCFITTSNSGSNILALYKMTPPHIKEKYNITFCHADEMKDDFFLGYDFLKEVLLNNVIVFDVRSPKYKTEHNIFFQLWHGFPLKGLGYTSPSLSELEAEKLHKNWSRFDKIASYSPFYNLVISGCMGVPNNKFTISGMPRNDFLFESNGRENLSEILNENLDAKKVVFLMPTYRNSIWLHEKSGDKIKGNIFGFEDFNNERFDKFLEEHNIHLVYKTHPLEENELLFQFEKFEFKNISLLTNKLLIHNNMDLYETLNSADLLITDYSSVYFDYLLLERPVIFTPVDISEYKSTRGLCLEPYEMWTPGPKVLTQEELQKEILSSLSRKDYYKQERETLLNLCHTFKDGNASKRVWDQIIKELENNE